MENNFSKVFMFLCLLNFSNHSADCSYDLNLLKDKINIIPLAVLGTGPAGLSAGIYGARSGLHTIVFHGPTPLGQLKDGILVENWPCVNKDSGINIMNNLEHQAKGFGTLLVNDTIKEVDFSTWPFKLHSQEDPNRCYYALSLVIATGATPKRLGVKNEDKYWIKGILSCPLCDAHLIKDQHAVVIGGGDSAVERILQLAPYAKEITLILRSEKVRAIHDMYKKIKDLPHVKILFNKDIESFEGDGNRLSGVNIIDTKTGEKSIVKTNWVFLSIGFDPNSSVFKKQLDLDSDGYINHDSLTQETNIKGIYVAGNVCDRIYKQASTASGDATKAAANAVKFLSDLDMSPELKKIVKQNSYYPVREDILKIESIASQKQLDEIINKREPVLIEFYSPLCSLCKSMKKTIGAIAYKYKDKMKFYKVDILKNRELAKNYNIGVVPEFLFFKDGKLIDSRSQELSRVQLIEFIELSLKS